MKNMKYKNILIMVLMTVPFIALGGIDNPVKGDLEKIIANVVKVAQVLILMVSVLYIIYAGSMFVFARGDTARIAEARNSLLYAMIGIGLVLGAQVLVETITTTVTEVTSSSV